MSCLFYRQERAHILFNRGPLLQIWAVGVERGIYGGYWLCVSSFILEILGWNCVKAYSCEKFEAKISKKSEKKGKRILEANKRISCETDLCSLNFRFEAKKIFKRNGRTLPETPEATKTTANQNGISPIYPLQRSPILGSSPPPWRPCSCHWQ
jgi:hypothetical protein